MTNADLRASLLERNAEHEPEFYILVNESQCADIASGHVPTSVMATYKFDGEFQSERQCAPCREAAGEFGFSILGGLLWENFYASWDDGAHLQACLNRLVTAEAKEHMRRKWLAWKGIESPPDPSMREKESA